MSIRIISSNEQKSYIKLVTPSPPSPIIIWMGLMLNNMLSQAEIDKEQEIEMAKILHEFVLSNAHFFSSQILAAAKVLLEEIEKAEAEKCLV